jgi:hypothetical protein
MKEKMVAEMFYKQLNIKLEPILKEPLEEEDFIEKKL